MPVPPLDDRALEALLSEARSAPAGLDWLLPFVEGLAEASSQPAPVVRPALATLLAEGSAGTSTTTRVGEVAAVAAVAPVVALAPAAAWAPSPRKHRRLGAKLAGLGLVAKVGLGVAVAAASTTVAGAAGVLPGPAQHAVATVVGAATPFTFPDSASPKADFGAKVSTDATGASDGVHGVDGKAVSDAAKNKHSGDNGVAGDPTSTTAGNAVGANDGATGLDRANQTPAAGHVPDSVPASTAPGEHGAKGLDTAATTPAGDHVPTSVPPTTEAGSAHGNDGSNGLSTASTTPAGGHVPSSVPARP